MNVYWSKRRKNEIRYEDRVDVSCDGGWGGRMASMEKRRGSLRGRGIVPLSIVLGFRE